MARYSKNHIPQISRQAGSDPGQDRAFVRLNKEKYYLGPHGSKEADRKYVRVISTWLANDRTLPPDFDPDADPQATDGGITIAEVLAAYLPEAEATYRK